MYPKLNHAPYFLGAVLVTIAFVALPAHAQQKRHTGARRAAILAQATSPLATVHKTFEEAAKMMESALPIYDGHRHRAIELARMSAREIKEAAEGKGPTLKSRDRAASYGFRPCCTGEEGE